MNKQHKNIRFISKSAKHVKQWVTGKKTASQSFTMPTEEQLNEVITKVWVLGKTGAGKSTLIREITGADDIEIGCGFMPCTQTTAIYQFPTQTPLIEFYDTRGLGEPGYNPNLDIAECAEQAHALMIVCQLDDPEISDLIDTLKAHKLVLPKMVLAVFTHASNGDKNDQERLVHRLTRQIESVLEHNIEAVMLDFITEYNIDQLNPFLEQHLPDIHCLLQKERIQTEESHAFLAARSMVITHASMAAASDAVPAVGVVSVPSIIYRMMQVLAEHYEVAWEQVSLRDFQKILGNTTTAAFGVNLIGRQALKFIPVWGQTVGAASAVFITSSVTYAIGRAACRYLYDLKHDNTIDAEAIRHLYEQALNRNKEESNHASDNS